MPFNKDILYKNIEKINQLSIQENIILFENRQFETTATATTITAAFSQQWWEITNS